ncbi:LysR family transcriptional regulator [Amycolatopsis methanolica 239]|uniref:LysR family transcriptional regulator n=1 Tax=Amycolatopsis methanolica 239 TaxID=1068978 RepID=A0A076MW31_AMYME|nr:LysR family transcriptional regulator [Amycolatopsis methanolica 239]
MLAQVRAEQTEIDVHVPTPAPGLAGNQNQGCRTAIIWRHRRRGDRVELRALRYFVTVADELHFGRAAERLHIAQPAVSRRIAALERELGVRLLDRSPRRVRLTEAGRRVLAAAREALAAVDRVRVAARECAGVMRIGTGAGQFTARLERGIDALRERPRDSTSCSSTCR